MVGGEHRSPGCTHCLWAGHLQPSPPRQVWVLMFILALAVSQSQLEISVQSLRSSTPSLGLPDGPWASSSAPGMTTLLNPDSSALSLPEVSLALGGDLFHCWYCFFLIEIISLVLSLGIWGKGRLNMPRCSHSEPEYISILWFSG